jgi:hypothetical protein
MSLPSAFVSSPTFTQAPYHRRLRALCPAAGPIGFASGAVLPENRNEKASVTALNRYKQLRF